MTKSSIWWKDATIYQVWPASYKDSNGDGVGDIPGIVSKLDYIKDLGVDIIWLSPMYASPQDDMGYDISDYNDIYPKYGTMQDMDKLINGCHDRGLKIILDLVINHTSTEHEWFKESKSSKTNPKRDWYIWKPPRYDSDGNRQPPNNWKSIFSECAWEWDETTQEYYLHLFAKSQAEVNWENKECRKALYESALRFWYEKGVDGFRIDTAGLYSKPQDFHDAPIKNPNEFLQPAGEICHNGPRIHEFHKEMYKEVTSHYDVMTVGEVGHCSIEDALKYVGASAKEMNMMFLFDLLGLGTGTLRFDYKGWDFKQFKQAIENQCKFFEGTDGWSTAFIENHDLPRCVSRFGNTENLENTFKSSKLIAMMQASLTGTLFIYQGQEIAMTNLPRSWDPSEYKDIESINGIADFKKKHHIESDDDPKMQKFYDLLALIARDHARSPVQWDSSAYGGFSSSEPWMRVNDNYKQINVELQSKDPQSVLSFYQKCLKTRKQYKELMVHGNFEVLDYENKQVLTFVKSHPDTSSKIYVVLNFNESSAKFEELIPGDYQVILSNTDEIGDQLAPWEGRVYLVE